MTKIKNFVFSLPTKIYFGKNQIERLEDEIKNFGNRILLVYGNKGIKSNDLYKKIYDQIKFNTIIELSNIPLNPTIDFVTEGAELCKRNHLDVILAVGGGSVIDCAKLISIAAHYSGNVWDLIKNRTHIDTAIPIIAVVTIYGSGSESNSEAVITNTTTVEKLTYSSDAILPKVAFLDPTLTFSLSPFFRSVGIVDMFSHVFEQYFVKNSLRLNDKLCEAVMKTIVELSSEGITQYNSYQKSAELMWCSNISDNLILSCGNEVSSYPVHAIEHEISAMLNVIHGVGIAVLLPAWMQYILSNENVVKFASYGRNVFNINEEDDWHCANLAIEETKRFIEGLKLPLTLSEINVFGNSFELIAEKALQSENLSLAFPPINQKDILNILNICK